MVTIEAYDSPDGLVRFYFSHSGTDFTTGVMVIKPGGALPKHRRPKAIENLVQVSGKCLVKVFEGEREESKEIPLEAGSSLQIPLNTYHIHSNSSEADSLTFFKAEGDISEAVVELKKTFKKVEL